MGVSFLTYNIWFDHRYRKIRIQYIANQISSLNPTYVCLQEVIEESANIIIPHLKKLGYHCCFADVKSFMLCLKQMKTSYGVLLFSKVPFEKVEAVQFNDTKMGRFYIKAKIDGVKLICTHLESLPPNSAARQSQIKQILSDIGDSPFIWGMDSNLLDGEDEQLIAPFDAFLKIGQPKDKCFTFDARRNGNVLNTRYINRLDRVLYRFSWKTELSDFSLVGTENIQEIGVPPSDHFGVLCKFQ